MYQFLETIRVANGTVCNIEYHQARVDKTFQEFFTHSPFSIEAHLDLENLNHKQIYKCRIEYNHEITKIEYLPYQVKNIKKLKLVEKNSIDYQYKFKDRTELKNLINENLDYDDIIITKDDFVTDTSYSNLLFCKNETWFTPFTFLLNGTQRQFLINSKQISAREIKISNLQEFNKFMLINAMLPFDEERALPMNLIHE